MEIASNMKALFIIVNAGFADEAVEIARAAGATGATIINARGMGTIHKSIMGITVDTEKEVIVSLAPADVADRIIAVIKEKAGPNTPTNGICFMMPVERVVG